MISHKPTSNFSYLTRFYVPTWRLNCSHSRNAVERKHEEKEWRKRAKELAAVQFLKGTCAGAKCNAVAFSRRLYVKNFSLDNWKRRAPLALAIRVLCKNYLFFHSRVIYRGSHGVVNQIFNFDRNQQSRIRGKRIFLPYVRNFSRFLAEEIFF